MKGRNIQITPKGVIHDLDDLKSSASADMRRGYQSMVKGCALPERVFEGPVQVGDYALNIEAYRALVRRDVTLDELRRGRYPDGSSLPEGKFVGNITLGDGTMITWDEYRKRVREESKKYSGTVAPF